MKAGNDEGSAVRTQTPQEQTKTDAAIVGEFVDKCNEDARQAEASALTLKLIRDIATGNESRYVPRSETKQAKGGRPRKHANAAARQAAYRANNQGVVTVRLGSVIDKVAEIAAAVDMPTNEMMHQMLKFALCNRDWKAEPMFVKPLPNAQHREKKNMEVGR